MSWMRVPFQLVNVAGNEIFGLTLLESIIFKPALAGQASVYDTSVTLYIYLCMHLYLTLWELGI